MKRITPGQWITALLALGVGLRLYALLAGEPYWYDEAFTWLTAHRPMADLITATAADVHPPLWYLLVRLFSSPAWARLLPFVFSVLGLVVYVEILTRLEISDSAQICALALLVLSPMQIFYSADLRMYSLLELLVLVQIYAILTRRYWLWGVATLAALYTHNYAVLYTAALGLLALYREIIRPVHVDDSDFGGVIIARCEESRTRLLIGWTALSIGLYLPWFVFATVPQMRFVSSGMHWVQPVTFGQAANALFAVTVTALAPKPLGPALYLGFASGLTLAVYSALTHKRGLLLAWSLGAFAVAVIGSLLVTPMILFRGLLPAAGGIYVLFSAAGDGAAPLWRRVGRGLMIASMLMSCLFFVDVVRTGESKGVAYNGDAPQQPFGLIAHLEDTTLVTWSMYGADNVLIDAGCPEQVAALGPVVRRALGLRTVRLEQLPASYTLVGIVGALSTQCHIDALNRLVDGAQEVRTVENEGKYYYGIWKVGSYARH